MAPITHTPQPPKSRERGASMLEYALLAALLAVGVIVSVERVGTEVNGAYSDIRLEFSEATGGADNPPPDGGGR